jgi:hypothetical protein
VGDHGSRERRAILMEVQDGVHHRARVWRSTGPFTWRGARGRRRWRSALRRQRLLDDPLSRQVTATGTGRRRHTREQKDGHSSWSHGVLLASARTQSYARGR